MDLDAPWCTPGLRFYQWMLEKNRRARFWNQARLRDLVRHHAAQVEVFCSHEARECERLSGRSAGIPAERLVAGLRELDPRAESEASNAPEP